MNSHSHPTRSQEIFSRNLPVEAVSLYLLCCGIIDEGKDLTLNTLTPLWNSTDAVLQDALAMLEDKNIIRKADSNDDADVRFDVMPPERWQ